MSSPSPSRIAVAVLALGPSLPAAQSADLHTDSPRELANLNIETVRGLAPAANGTLYALNTHASQIVVHSDADPEPEHVWQTLLNPVSIAIWEDYLVVVGGGTHALALHDAGNGDILKVLQLPSEPADLVIDVVDAEQARAFVACQGANEVVQVDLIGFEIAAHYPIPAESPRMLCLDKSEGETRVYVAPFLSGNNSTVLNQPDGKRSTVQDLDALGLELQLPDEDLFEIDPSEGTVTAVLRRAGTLLMGHGRNPKTEAYWILNVEARNKAEGMNTEARVRGRFALNRLTIAQPEATVPVPVAETFVDLDDIDPTAEVEYHPSRAMGFPFALEFATHPAANGLAFVASPLNDRVAMLSKDGEWLGLIQLLAGSIPFDLALDATGTKLYTYCWGTNTVQVNSLLQPGVSWTLELGVDPTPERIRDGRTLWYDGERSLNARFSCNTCHPGGRSDLLGWSITDDPNDPKDVMVTQSLLSIEDTFPFHWRGERSLLDFNGAFPGLLGAEEELSTGEGSEFEAFQAFVFSLQAPANPRQHISREAYDFTPAPEFTDYLVDPPETYEGSAVTGQELFLTAETFLGRTCASCHQPPTGSRGDFVNEVGAVDAPTAKSIEVPHLRELRHKDQPAFVVTSLGLQIRSRGGFGITHNGEFANLFHFINQESTFRLEPQQAADVAAFVQQWDNGLAPAAHAAFLVDGDTPPPPDSENYLLEQAGPPKRWIDCVAFGWLVDPSTETVLRGRWLYDPVEATFQHNDTGESFAWDTITTQASAGLARLAFLGVPPLNGKRFALDPDNDHLSDWLETAAGTDRFDPDSDGDGQPDEYELENGGDPNWAGSLATDEDPPVVLGTHVDFESASLAKVTLSSNEDVTLTSTFATSTPPGGASRSFLDPVLSRDKTFVLQGLEASTPGLPWAPTQNSPNLYSPTIMLTDRAGWTTPVTLDTFTSGDMILPPASSGRGAPFVVANLQGIEIRAGNTLKIAATVTVRHRYMTPGTADPDVLEGWVVLAQLVVGPAPDPDADPDEVPVNWEYVPSNDTLALSTTVKAGGFQIVDEPPPPDPPIIRDFRTVLGPFLFSAATDPSGVTYLDLAHPGLVKGQKVRLNILGILEPHPEAEGETMQFRGSSLATYQVAPTPTDNRGLAITF